MDSDNLKIETPVNSFQKLVKLWVKFNDIAMKSHYDKKHIIEIDIIEKLLNLEDDEIKQLHYSWDMGDCSLVGITEIYLYQSIKKHKIENGIHYDTSIDEIKLRIK